MLYSTQATRRKALKSYYCDWCGELIRAKTHYMRWEKLDKDWVTSDGMNTGGWSTYRMHPECLGAFEKLEHVAFRPQTHPRPVVEEGEDES
jgi:hypothetical protein